MPEKSGMDAALCAAISACPAAGAACCPEAGPATATNVASKSKFRRAFMSTSVDELVCPARPGAIDTLSQMPKRRTTVPGAAGDLAARNWRATREGPAWRAHGPRLTAAPVGQWGGSVG